MTERVGRFLFWCAVTVLATAIICADIWTARDVRDWVFGQTGAAWVQALGSGAAIYAAFKIGNMQVQSALRLEQHKRQATQSARFAALLALYRPVQHHMDRLWVRLTRLAKDGVNDLKGIGDAHAVSFSLELFVPQYLRPLQRYLQTVDVLDYGDAAHQLVELATAIDLLAENQEEFKLAFHAAEFNVPESVKPIQGAAHRVAGRIGWSLGRLVACCAALGVEPPPWVREALMLQEQQPL